MCPPHRLRRLNRGRYQTNLRLSQFIWSRFGDSMLHTLSVGSTRSVISCKRSMARFSTETWISVSVVIEERFGAPFLRCMESSDSVRKHGYFRSSEKWSGPCGFLAVFPQSYILPAEGWVSYGGAWPNKLMHHVAFDLFCKTLCDLCEYWRVISATFSF